MARFYIMDCFVATLCAMTRECAKASLREIIESPLCHFRELHCNSHNGTKRNLGQSIASGILFARENLKV